MLFHWFLMDAIDTRFNGNFIRYLTRFIVFFARTRTNPCTGRFFVFGEQTARFMVFASELFRRAFTNDSLVLRHNVGASNDRIEVGIILPLVQSSFGTF